ncbi:MAG: EF-P lysine aminoacylase EpmA [Alphaproteobacteria bacterium]
MSHDWWRPEQIGRRRGNLEVRATTRRTLREWFVSQDFLEVETPALQQSPGMEPHLAAFATRLLPPGGFGVTGETGTPRYLHTSPEFAMKKLLAGGLERIWQICPVFRNAEGSALHSPEFSMLEWYRADRTYDALMEDSAAILSVTAKAASATALTRGESTCDPFAEPERLSVADAFGQFCDIDLTAILSEDPEDPPTEPLVAAAKGLGIRTDRRDLFEDLFFRIMDARIEPNLGMGRACLLYDYPISMAALARRKPGSDLWAERVELYVCGVELANGFSELTDAEEQRARFDWDMALKRKLYGVAYPVDESFLDALSQMPQAAGMAMGFDRLVMLLTGAERINDVLWAPVE